MPRARARTRSTPLHERILRELRGHVLTLPAGAPLPSERTLAAEYRVSRMTARAAVQALRAEGLAYSQRGRGMFVAAPRIDVHARRPIGFSAQMRTRGLEPGSRLLEFRRIDATPAIADELALEPGSPVFRIDRLRFANGVPVAFESTHVPAHLVANLYRFNLERDSLYRILREEQGIRFGRAREHIEAAMAGRLMAHLFRLSPSEPVLIVKRVVFSANDEPVDATTATYRADRYQACFEFVVEPA